MTSFNIREQEAIDFFFDLPLLQNEVLPYAEKSPDLVREILAALGTALDFRRQLPNPQNPPFQGRKPRMVVPIFFLTCTFLHKQYICVALHRNGWIAMFHTYMTAQRPYYEAERYIDMVADWESTPVPCVATAKDADRKNKAELPGRENISGMELYPIFLSECLSQGEG